MPSVVERGCCKSRKLEERCQHCATHQLCLPSGKSFHGKDEEKEEGGENSKSFRRSGLVLNVSHSIGIRHMTETQSCKEALTTTP